VHASAFFYNFEDLEITCAIIKILFHLHLRSLGTFNEASSRIQAAKQRKSRKHKNSFASLSSFHTKKRLPTSKTEWERAGNYLGSNIRKLTARRRQIKCDRQRATHND
jgi:hypothetical protein